MKKALTREEFKKEIIRIYLDFSYLCNKLDLRHWIAFGTLLGATRHKGFIPWDDDFDVFMPRPDYEKLLDFFRSKNNQYGFYSLLDARLTKHYPYCFPRFNDNRFIENEPGNRKSYGLGLNFDIYPLDGAKIGDTNQIKRLQKLKRNLDLQTNYKKPKGKNAIRSILKMFARVFFKMIPTKITIAKMHKVAVKYDFDSSEFCGDIVWDPHLKLQKREWYNETVFLEFENIKCPAPKGYVDFLINNYGDYMKFPPMEKRVGYHLLEIRPK